MRLELPASGCPGRRAALWSRRELLRTSANGFGLVALAGLMADDLRAAPSAGVVARPQPHFKPRARNVIFCFMDGGVSHVDSFDPKPKLAELDGQAFNE